MVYNDKNSTFNELLGKNGSASIHQQILQKLAVEMFKVSSGLSPEIINETFQFRKQRRIQDCCDIQDGVLCDNINGWKPSTIITKRSLLDVAAVIDPPLERK